MSPASSQKFRSVQLFVIAIIFSMCCDEPIPPPVICDCVAPNTNESFNTPSLVVNTTRGYFLLSVDLGFINLCSTLNSEFQQDGLMLFASGRIKSTCNMVGNSYKIPETFSVFESGVKATDSLFTNLPDYKIKIIRSEDYGHGPGYGYHIEIRNSSDILQPFQPAISGYNPFKTPTDAYKVALLVVFKLSTNRLPSIAIEDLVFLQTI
jgi:hypothetical protein